MVESASTFPYTLAAVKGSGNYDVLAGEEHKGRLYVLPVTEEELVAQGIEKQWFLTHQQGNLVLSGHINNAQEWSLSQPRSLEPTGQYVSQVELFAIVFSEDYIQAVCNSQAVNQVAEGISRQETVSESQPLSVGASVGVPNATGTSGSSEGQPIKVSGAILGEEFEQLVLSEQNLSGLPLGVAETSESELSQEEQEGSELQEDKESEVAEDFEKPDMAELEQKRQQLERQLAAVLLEGCQQNLLDFDADDGDSAWVLSSEGGEVFSIYSRSDGHLVLSVSQQGEILNPLSGEDAETIGWRLLEPEAERQQQQEREFPEILGKVEKSSGIELD